MKERINRFDNRLIDDEVGGIHGRINLDMDKAFFNIDNYQTDKFP